MTLIESRCKPEAALLDIVDYRILRAVMRTYARTPAIDADAGLTMLLAWFWTLRLLRSA